MTPVPANAHAKREPLPASEPEARIIYALTEPDEAVLDRLASLLATLLDDPDDAS